MSRVCSSNTVECENCFHFLSDQPRSPSSKPGKASQPAVALLWKSLAASSAAVSAHFNSFFSSNPRYSFHIDLEPFPSHLCRDAASP
jgi:hypothetical protein